MDNRKDVQYNRCSLYDYCSTALLQINSVYMIMHQRQNETWA